MPPPGGGGVGNPPRTAGAEIVQNMFDQAQAKPLEAEQQAQQLRQQSQVQEQQRGATRESEGTPAQETKGREGREAAARRAGSDAPVQETEMDQFLSRSSDQQVRRDAGRQLSRPQTTVGSANAQNWTVANSPNTPESARALLQQKSQGTPSQPQASRTPQGQTQTSRPPAEANPMLARALSTPPRAPQDAPPRTLPLLIQYTRAHSSGGETSARAFSTRAFSPDSMFQQVQKLVQNQLGGAAQQFTNTAEQVAVNLRGNLVFVKDGKEFRAFRLNKDGSLTELPSEDGGDHPLSPEAEALLGKVLRQRAVQVRKGDGSLRGSEKAETGKAEPAMKEGKAADSKGEAKTGALDFETRFALLLHQVLEEGHDLEQPLGEDGPSFPDKSDWEAFFARMSKLGNQEKSSQKSLEDVLGMIFRGLFKKGGAQNTLVGDLKYALGAKTKEQKFTQVAVSDEKFLEWLGQLKPGQSIGKEQLQKMFGGELAYLELDHIAEQLKHIQAEESGKNVVFNPKGNIDAFSQARLERSLFGNRKNNPRPQADAGQAFPPPLPAPGAESVPANVYELLGLRERYRGNPRLYTFVLYALAGSAIGIAVASFFL